MAKEKPAERTTIKTLKDAKAFVASEAGQSLPMIQDYFYHVKDAFGKSDAKTRYNLSMNMLEMAATNPVEYSLQALKNTVRHYVVYQNLPNGGKLAKSEAERFEGEFKKAVNYLNTNGIGQEQINPYVEAGTSTAVKALEKHVKRISKKDWTDKMFDASEKLIISGLTSGLGGIKSLAANSALSLASRAPIKNVALNELVSYGAGEVGKYVQGMDAPKAVPTVAQSPVKTAVSSAANSALRFTQDFVKNVRGMARDAAPATTEQNPNGNMTQAGWGNTKLPGTDMSSSQPGAADQTLYGMWALARPAPIINKAMNQKPDTVPSVRPKWQMETLANPPGTQQNFARKNAPSQEYPPTGLIYGAIK